ncbi:MAG TPA: MOSC domain-containing protein, partial [Thiotrichaceae bacterium]|nr:MOSC domain-containing protein [Thiotrichaceae bacterium]
MPIITHLYRYPIKGLSPEPLQRVAVQAGEMMPLDRCFALA